MMSSVAAKKTKGPRSLALREHDQRIITNLRLQGYDPASIVDYFEVNYGRSLSVATVDRAWNAVRGKWAEEIIDDLTPYMNEQLAGNETLLSHAWERYREAEGALAQTDREESKLRMQAFVEVKYWFDQINRLRDERAKLLRLNRDGISINIDNRQQVAQVPTGPVKGYVLVSPDDWPDPPAALPARVNYDEGIYVDADA